MADDEFEVDEPDLAEIEAARGRHEVATLEGVRPLLNLLDSPVPAVLTSAANALFNLTIEAENADMVREAGGLAKLHGLLGHEEAAVVASMAGVLMNCCASSSACLDDLAAAGLLDTLLPLLRESLGEEGPLAAPELGARLLGALNNLLLHAATARAIRPAGALGVILRPLTDADASEAMQEDAASSLVRVLQEDDEAGGAMVEAGMLSHVVPLLDSPNEELQVRACGLIAQTCRQHDGACAAALSLGAVPQLLRLISSSAEEVQEAAASSIHRLSAHPPAAVVARREGVAPLLIELMGAPDPNVQLVSISALLNVTESDPKMAAAMREAEGLPAVAGMLTSECRELRVAAARVVAGCAKNETNKSILREIGVTEPLIGMLAHTAAEDEHSAALSALVELAQNEDEASVLIRLQGGLKRLRQLLYCDDPVRPSLAAAVLYHCAPNADTRVAMRVTDTLRPLIALLSSQLPSAREAAAGALMLATQGQPTNQVKCRELGAIAPLVAMLEPPASGPPSAIAIERAAWCLSNLLGDASAARQLVGTAGAVSSLVSMISQPNLRLQRPAMACILNAMVNDPEAPAALGRAGGFAPLAGLLALGADLGAESAENADESGDAEIVAWAAGALMNAAAAPDEAESDLATHARAAAPALLGCVRPDGGSAALNANAAGALMNVTARSDATVGDVLAREGAKRLFDLLAASAEEPLVAAHAAGAIANLMTDVGGRADLVPLGGVRVLADALESALAADESDDLLCACCVALLNGCHENAAAHEALADTPSGISALVSCLAVGSSAVRAAAAGALLNASASRSCAEMVRDAAADDADGGAKGGIDVLLECLSAGSQSLRSRAAGALLNIAAYGPDNRLAMLEMGALKKVVGALSALGDGAAPARHELHARLIGVVVNCALNPACKHEILHVGGLKPLLEAVAVDDAQVQMYAATAIAYLNDKAEHRPGSPSAGRYDSPAAQSYRKIRFHATGDSPQSPRPGDKPFEEPADDPGARTKAGFGTLPHAKFGSTHDDQAKGPRIVSEPTEPFSRKLQECVQPEDQDAAYVEIPSPLPSPRG